MLDLTFSVFADFHYKKGMYAATVADLEAILKRAWNEHADFIIHAGDFSNDYLGSPEVVHLYLKNPYQLPAYGIYGNHELVRQPGDMTLFHSRPILPLCRKFPVGDFLSKNNNILRKLRKNGYCVLSLFVV